MLSVLKMLSWNRLVVCLTVYMALVTPGTNAKPRGTLTGSAIKYSTDRENRGLWQFGSMISCATQRSPLDYTDYGCFCGYGGGGTPMDGVDRCCQMHDSCYDMVMKKCWSIYPYLAPYSSTCKNRRITCHHPWWSWSQCPMMLCECDRMAAYCFTWHDYNPDNYGRCEQPSASPTQ
ncbi:acidic phospholipase A2 E-like [Branchiostoma floridae]|uniref:Phospholipase A2 n=1 Tax=Branchiostoma floridae TaxID=7739 RepID=A0A9J7LWE3_BRAFL|nr:acidic phospholipase A2 E-like [Branchiostoma floridae]